ncbi:MAG: hypothetical protein GY861_13990 [bacterium]|nr:hypothetical protein [bacterium]
MAQEKRYSFGIDNATFVDEDCNVYSIEDPQNFNITMTYEKAEHRGGTNNDVRATKVHTRGAEITLGTGVVDESLAQLLTGGTLTSLGTSAASITTGTANGVNTLTGTTASIPTAITSIVINSPSLVETDDYYLEGLDFDAVKVVRVNDGKIIVSSIALTTAAEINIDTDRGLAIFTAATGFDSITVGEKAYVTTRKAITEMNQAVSFDSNKPGKLSLRASVTDDGVQRLINVPVAQPTGSVQGMSASEFILNDLTMGAEVSSLGELANIISNK